MNPYFHPMKKPDGGEWPALVERCPECRPNNCAAGGLSESMFQVGEWFLWVLDGDDPPANEDDADALGYEPEFIATLLARERAIAWLQSQHRSVSLWPGGDVGVRITEALWDGATDEAYARLCHECIDAKENA